MLLRCAAVFDLILILEAKSTCHIFVTIFLPFISLFIICWSIGTCWVNILCCTCRPLLVWRMASWKLTVSPIILLLQESSRSSESCLLSQYGLSGNQYFIILILKLKLYTKLFGLLLIITAKVGITISYRHYGIWFCTKICANKTPMQCFVFAHF